MAWLRGKKSQWTTKNLLLILLVIKDIFDRYLAIFGIFWGQFGPLQGQMLLLSFVDFFLWIKVVIVDSWYKQTKIEIVFWNTIYTRANHSEKEVQKCTRNSFIVHTSYRLDVNRSSWSKLFLLHNFMNIDGTTVLFFLSPPLVAGPQKPQKLTTSKIKYKHFGAKILILH